VFVHDPQPVYLPQFTPPGRVRRWVWRCHIDASQPNRAIWRYIERAIPHYHGTIFSMAAFTRPLPTPMFVIPPAIDPLSDKNCPISEDERLATLNKLGIDPQRPLLLQVSRFDRFKDPLGVIQAYRLIKPYYPICNWPWSAARPTTIRRAPRCSAKFATSRARTAISRCCSCLPIRTGPLTRCSAPPLSSCRSR